MCRKNRRARWQLIVWSWSSRINCILGLAKKEIIPLFYNKRFLYLSYQASVCNITFHSVCPPCRCSWSYFGNYLDSGCSGCVQHCFPGTTNDHSSRAFSTCPSRFARSFTFSFSIFRNMYFRYISFPSVFGALALLTLSFLGASNTIHSIAVISTSLMTPERPSILTFHGRQWIKRRLQKQMLRRLRLSPSNYLQERGISVGARAAVAYYLYLPLLSQHRILQNKGGKAGSFWSISTKWLETVHTCLWRCAKTIAWPILVTLIGNRFQEEAVCWYVGSPVDEQSYVLILIVGGWKSTLRLLPSYVFAVKMMLTNLYAGMGD